MRMKKKMIIISFVSILMALRILGDEQHKETSPEEYLELHNAARASVGVPPLKWDVKLENIARKNVNRLVKDCFEGKAEQTRDDEYGMNVAWNMGYAQYTGRDVVKGWLTQKQYYDYKSNSCPHPNCICYTRIVWRESSHVGCARACCQKGCTIVMCLYNPPGNVPGERPYLLH
ncbi:hypothetical protein PIB30_066321 [Stylosanthes scabra]|uniref:SCP domain-containing protein n=1 Tax=Stylosanthes scabra TaxID=79078 RepID=A0ABU6XL91_9FABA|nr:hypothetical protein [Stylosanthes scabra]